MSWGILFAEGSEQHIVKDKHQPAYILSRSAAEKLLQDGFPRNTFVISFYDPPSKRTGQVSQPPDYRGMPLDVFYVPLHDIDLEILEKYGLSYDTYFPEAPALAAFIYDAMENGGNIVCQCEYGQSRSAACAAAIPGAFLWGWHRDFCGLPLLPQPTGLQQAESGAGCGNASQGR